MIDRIREQIQERLDQLTGEVDRLRQALAALDPRTSKAPARKPSARKPSAQRAARATATKPAASGTKRTPARRARPATSSSRRAAPGQTRSAVLDALAGGEAMTAGQVAEKCGLSRASVSTTLSRLAKTGEVQKAERGYRLPPAVESVPTPSSAPTAAVE